MKVTFLEQAGITKELRKLMSTFDEFYWAVAWGTVNKLSEDLIASRGKIKQLTFGTHFYQSDPELLENFKGKKFARVMPNDAAGTFHPKVYLFMNCERAAAIVGSANFTSGAMNKNNEAAILLEGAATDDTIIGIRAMVNNAWKTGKEIDQEFLDNYRLRHRATARHRRELEKQRKNVKPDDHAANKALRMWTWDQYASEVRRGRFHFFDGRLSLLKEARELFATMNSFSDMGDDERRAIAGLLSKGQTIRDGGIDEWGWFGSMKGQGDFTSRINANNQYFSDALDAIPSNGEVWKEQFDEYVKLFGKAFEGASHKGGVPTASRLLTMKRPDMFVCVNSENRTKLGGDLGFAPTTLTFDKYWNDVIIPITESNWWQATRPSGRDGQLWDGRAAMLDSIYYEGHI